MPPAAQRRAEATAMKRGWMCMNNNSSDILQARMDSQSTALSSFSNYF